jgi:hypothetical protein
MGSEVVTMLTRLAFSGNAIVHQRIVQFVEMY